MQEAGASAIVRRVPPATREPRARDSPACRPEHARPRPFPEPRGLPGMLRVSKAHDAGSGIMLTYFTPVYARTMPRAARTNAALRRLVLDREQTTPGEDKSNVGGWHSAPDLFSSQAPEVRELLDWVCAAVLAMSKYMSQTPHKGTQIETRGWANVSRNGDYHRAHMHPGHDWSGIYYVDPGEHPAAYPDSGIIEFHDPRCAVGILETPGKPFWGTVHFRPEAGMLLLFPSWLVHTVNPYRGERERISIAFNVRMVSPTPGTPGVGPP